MKYLGNAFSLGMMDDLHNGAGYSSRTIVVEGTSLEIAQKWVREGGWESIVGHADTAVLLSSMLGVEVPMRRVSTVLKDNDQVLVAQYNGPRLPEGAVSLPEGAKIRWYFVRLGKKEPYASSDNFW